jgi:hypothetical protein
MATRKLNRTLNTAPLLGASISARPDTVDAQMSNASCERPIIGYDEQQSPIYGPPFGCDVDATPGRPVSGVNTSRGRGPVCTYRPGTAGEVIGIANQQPEPGIDVNAPTPQATSMADHTNSRSASTTRARATR